MPNPPFLLLGAELAREQERVLGDKRISELDLLRDMGRSRRRLVRRYRQIAFVLVGLLVVITTIIAAGISKFPVVRYAVDREPVEQTGRDGFGRWFVASAEEPKVITFTDGSLATPATGARIRVTGTSRRGASLVLESGSVELQVAGSRVTEYQVAVGPFVVALAKGRMGVSWDPINDLLDLVVREGYVVISGCQFEVGRSVMAGRELSTGCINR